MEEQYKDQYASNAIATSYFDMLDLEVLRGNIVHFTPEQVDSLLELLTLAFYRIKVFGAEDLQEYIEFENLIKNLLNEDPA